MESGQTRKNESCRGHRTARALLRLAACAALLAPLASQAQNSACVVNSLQSFAPPSTTLTLAERRTAPVPYCYVEGYITADNPGPSRVLINLALPDNFNGRYFLASQGGAAGRLIVPSTQRLQEGFAIASTDRGTRPRFGVDFSWRGDPIQLEDWSHRSSHLTAQSTQQITRSYYGVTHMYRYEAGCSGGGQAGWATMQVYGAQDFDGVVVGDTTGFTGLSNAVAFGRVSKYLMQNPGSWISPELLTAGQAALIAAYDGVDGAVDGIIADDRLIKVIDENILRKVGFTEAQLATFRFIKGPWTFHLTAQPQQFQGFGWSRLAAWRAWLTGSVPPPWNTSQPGIYVSGTPTGYTVADSFLRGSTGNESILVTDVDYETRSGQMLLRTTERPELFGFDLRRFRDGGGKFIYYTGVGDPVVPYQMPIKQFELMAQYEFAGNSGKVHPNAAKKQADWARLFLLPGGEHCAAGATGPDAGDVDARTLAAVIAWVEHGKAPDSLVVSRAASGRTFLLCPEPERAIFSGGDVNDAANWKCRKPQK